METILRDSLALRTVRVVDEVLVQKVGSGVETIELHQPSKHLEIEELSLWLHRFKNGDHKVAANSWLDHLSLC
jgi:hypothetical protein